jgi:hypothetical protein
MTLMRKRSRKQDSILAPVIVISIAIGYILGNLPAIEQNIRMLMGVASGVAPVIAPLPVVQIWT